MLTKKHLSKSEGSTIIEVVVFLPVFLLGLFFIIWLAVVSNAKSALVNAVNNGVRLAATRAENSLYNKPAGLGQPPTGAIPALDSWKLSTVVDPILEPSRPELLKSPSIPSMAKYNDKVDDLFAGNTNLPKLTELRELPVEYAYAITYIVQNLRLGVSERLRYPCDPTDPADPEGGENCLICRPVNPITLKDETFERRPDGTRLTDASVIERRFAIRCDYKPTGFLLRPMLSLMSMVTGRPLSGDGAVGVISHAGYFGRDSQCSFQPADAATSTPARYCCDMRCN